MCVERGVQRHKSDMEKQHTHNTESEASDSRLFQAKIYVCFVASLAFVQRSIMTRTKMAESRPYFSSTTCPQLFRRQHIVPDCKHATYCVLSQIWLLQMRQNEDICLYRTRIFGKYISKSFKSSFVLKMSRRVFT